MNGMEEKGFRGEGVSVSGLVCRGDNKKPSRCGEGLGKGPEGRLLGGFGATAFELGGELLDAAGGVDDALFAGVGGVRIHRHVANDDEIVRAVDLLFTSRLHGGLGEEAFAGAYVEEANVVESGMAFGFHGGKNRG